MPHMPDLAVVVYVYHVVFWSVFHVAKIEPFREELTGESFGVARASSAWIVIPPTLEVHLGFLSLQMVNIPHGLLKP